MDPYHDGLIHNSPSDDPELLPGQQSLPYVAKLQQQDVQAGEPEPEAPAQTPRTICGIRRITFLLLVVIAILILVGAIGGGVGGSLAVQNARNSASTLGFVTSSSEFHAEIC
jgi:hypothetical protein